MAKKQTALEKLMKQLEAVLTAEYEATHRITREGDRLIIPAHMEINDAIQALQTYQDQMEETVESRVTLHGHPHDCLVCLTRAMEATFGQFIGAKDVKFSFFGAYEIPAQMHSVAIGYNETMSVPIGKVSTPGLPIEIEINPVNGKTGPLSGGLIIDFSYRRKFEPLVKRIEELVRKELRTNSIFKGKALTSRFEFVNVNADTSKLVYTEAERAALQTNLFLPIKHRDLVVAMGEKVKRTILLHGKFGTGKTLTAIHAAKMSVESGWTFMNVQPGDSIVEALGFAAKFQPCVLFFEDIDSVTNSDSGKVIGEILNTIDGALSKDSQVITILTTNNLQNIHRGMLRPGRIDKVLELGVLDQEATARLVAAYAGDQLEGELDPVAIFEASDRFVPAFVADGVHEAKMYAAARLADGNGSHIDAASVRITSQDIVHALKAKRPQFDMMMDTQHRDQAELSLAMESLVRDTVGDVLSDNGTIETLATRIAEKI